MTFDKYLSYAEESRNYSGAEMLMAEIGNVEEDIG